MKKNETCTDSRKVAFRAGFSLIELLVVIAIIAILAAIVSPVINTAMARGKSVECQNNLKQWGLALGMYLDEHNGVFPTDGSKVGGNVADPMSTNAWFNLLPPYVGQSTMAQMRDNGRIAVPGGGKSMFICPASPIEGKLLADYNKTDSRGYGSQETYYNSYGYNWWIDNSKGNRADISKLMRSSQVKNPKAFAVFADSPTGHWKGGEGGGSTPSYRYAKTHPTAMAEAERGNAFRHAGRANVCFADGHVASFARHGLWFKGMTTDDNCGGVQWNPLNDDLGRRR